MIVKRILGFLSVIIAVALLLLGGITIGKNKTTKGITPLPTPTAGLIRQKQACESLQVMDFDGDKVKDKLTKCSNTCYPEGADEWQKLSEETKKKTGCKEPHLILELHLSKDNSTVTSVPVWTRDYGAILFLPVKDETPLIALEGLDIGAHSSSSIIFRLVDGKLLPVPILMNKDNTICSPDEVVTGLLGENNPRDTDFARDETGKCNQYYTFWADAGGGPVIKDEDKDGYPEVQILLQNYDKPFGASDRTYLHSYYRYKEGVFVRDL